MIYFNNNVILSVREMLYIFAKLIKYPQNKATITEFMFIVIFQPTKRGII